MSADEAGGQGRMLGWKCNYVCGTMEQVYSVYSTRQSTISAGLNKPVSLNMRRYKYDLRVFLLRALFIELLSKFSRVLRRIADS